jgi:hypothetical protein
LWLNDNSHFGDTLGSNSKAAKRASGVGDDAEEGKSDQTQIILSLLEDSLSPLKCSFNSKCFFE